MKTTSSDNIVPSNQTNDNNTAFSAMSKMQPTTMTMTRADTTIGSWGKWANRFIVVAILQGAIAAGVSAFFLYDSQYGSPGAARIAASGGPGVWMVGGYLGFLILGPLGAAVTSLFYQHLGSYLRAPSTGLNSALAWLHLVLMNIGVAGASLIMMWGGWRGGQLALTLSPSNPAAAYGQVHVQVLGALPPYIGAFGGLAVLGAIFGGIGYVVAWRRAAKHA